MRKAALALSLLLAVQALAARLDVPEKPRLDPVQSPGKAQALRNALAAFPLDDGSLWVTHFVPAKREPNAIGVTRLGPDGSSRVFLVSDWLPAGSLAGGWCGQVYAVTLLTDGRVAVSAGWNDGTNSHNAIFVLRAGEDGRYSTDKRIDWPGVAEIVGGPRNTILAVTFDASRRGGGPLLTLFESNGRMRAKAFDQDERFSPVEAAQNAMNTRLHRFDERTFAVYDASKQSVVVWDLDVQPDDTIWSGRSVVFLGDDPTTADVPVKGISMSEDGDIIVVRVGKIRGTSGTHLTVYHQNMSIQDTATLDRPWKLMLKENGRLRGVVVRDDVTLETVAFRAEK